MAAMALVPRDNSGPLLDNAGSLLGVVSLKASRFASNGGSDEATSSINFAVKSAPLAQFLDASRVTYKVGEPYAKAMEPTDIADRPQAISGFPMCW